MHPISPAPPEPAAPRPVPATRASAEPSAIHPARVTLHVGGCAALLVASGAMPIAAVGFAGVLGAQLAWRRFARPAWDGASVGLGRYLALSYAWAAIGVLVPAGAMIALGSREFVGSGVSASGILALFAVGALLGGLAGRRSARRGPARNTGLEDTA